MLVLAVFTPHPPLIIPEIGKEDLREVKKTVDAMEELGQRVAKADPETIVIISPHGLIHQQEMLIGASPKMTGSFENFDCPEINLSFSGNEKIASEIHNQSSRENIPSNIIDHEGGKYFLDHGIMVPLYYLTKEIGSGVKIVPIGYSMLSRANHFAFGQIIADVIDKSDERVAVVASGDLSHRLFETNIGKIGYKFDQTIVDNIKNFDPGKIIDIDEELQDMAGECGYRSLLILLGVLDGRRSVKAEVLSYEGPFGVGYMVADFRLR